jgi:hypothetical protein
MDHTFTFSSNGPYVIKDENRNILQIAEKEISAISLARQHLKASKESLDAWPSIHSEGQTSLEYSETFKEIRTFCDQKLEKVCHVVSLLIDCEALMSTLDFVPQVLSPSIVKLLSISTGKKENFLYRDRQAIKDYPEQTYSHLIRNPSPSIWKKLPTSRNY